MVVEKGLRKEFTLKVEYNIKRMMKSQFLVRQPEQLVSVDEVIISNIY